eukprot:TRINITY_DN24278_c0_g1_i1.p1 TRINITY_DN24278_c0_g1~~TRINITY_DN24278_c0_g1_i1.p1  ORF type:complete len:102 (+),score=12.74 TRINITY_DN24278_c0_g1_i1:56-361(+)
MNLQGVAQLNRSEKARQTIGLYKELSYVAYETNLCFPMCVRDPDFIPGLPYKDCVFNCLDQFNDVRSYMTKQYEHRRSSKKSWDSPSLPTPTTPTGDSNAQ